MPKQNTQSRINDDQPLTDAEAANASLYGLDIAQTGAFGLVQIHTWRDQERFLANFTEVGMKGLAARATGVHRETVRLWERGNVFAFNPRLADALEIYVDLHDERLSELSFETLQPLPTIAKLNAYRPERYKRETMVIDNKAQDALNELKQMALEARQRALAAADEDVVTEIARAEAIIAGKAEGAPGRGKRAREEADTGE